MAKGRAARRPGRLLRLLPLNSGPCTEPVAEGRAAVRGDLFSTPLRVANDFGPGPEAIPEGRAAGRGDCFSASLYAEIGRGPEALAEGRAAGRGDCFPAPLAADFGPGPVAEWCRLDGETASLHLSPLTSGLVRKRWLRGALLDGELLCAFAADFGPGPGSNSVAAGLTDGSWVCFSTPLINDFGSSPAAVALQGRQFASLVPLAADLK